MTDTPHDTAHDPAREAAFRLIRGVTSEGRSLGDQAGDLAGLPPDQRARAGRLAAQTLRHAARADALLAPLLRRSPPDAVRDALRLAVVEMAAEAAPPHAVVNDAVARARRLGASFAGLTNAVLRKVDLASWDALPPATLPAWLRTPLVKHWGKGVAAAIEAAHLIPAPIDLTPRSGDATALAEQVGGTALPTGSVRLPAGTQVTALPGYATGDWWVQDAAAALPARLLAAQPGEAVADLCAAPGGKTLQLAAHGARVTALDLSPSRAERISQNLTRCNLTAEVVIGDALDWRPAQPLDAVLLDAPCSATGTIRRHPDLPLLRDGAAIPQIVALQARLIDAALAMLRPGGRLVYAVCSLHPAEGEGQIAAALTRHPDLRLLPADLPGTEAFRAPDGSLRTRPDLWADRGGIDGFYIAALTRD
ncbi:RsmB/NOP family class I SAM-dependent RNA methyltransferase [Paracoccus sp. p4-l81]|uniref:RsmB/NOP family class I SAM-dependent RNA methyltransferase n=1 Tax=Paracoccus sp. p4-l81 TaxID=3342806 RepID=UPI0035B81C93